MALDSEMMGTKCSRTIPSMACNEQYGEDTESERDSGKQNWTGDSLPFSRSYPKTIYANEGSKSEPIAIIGMACRLPGGVTSPSKLWELLMEGRSGHCDVPDSRFHVDNFYHPDPNNPGTTHTKGGYFLSEDISAFENQFFGINNREATSMDPQQRKLLEVTYECFEDAGVGLQEIAGANVGCYVGNFTADFASMHVKDPELFTRYSATGMGSTILANRLTHVFDLRGPSLVLDTACSSSLYCLHVACTALESRECDAAVVAGVNLIQGPEHHIATAKAGILSASSTCHTFDSSADGYGRADGVGALYVKRFSDAIRDGDSVRSIIRGTAINSNGRTNGITLPSTDGQESVIRKAYAKAGLDVGSTDYVECHGTGTAVGDPIEVEALARVFRDSHSEVPLLLGSVKTNLGHSEAASGITSIIKTTLAFERGLIPATINLRDLNPKIKAQDWNVKVVTEPSSWPATNHTPRASINSFGYGGANAHAILEPASAHLPSSYTNKPLSQGDDSGSSYILPISASNRTALEEKAASISSLAASSLSLRELAYTLGSRRTHFSLRGYFIADTPSWQKGLATEVLRTIETDSHRGQLPYAFVFSGQGAQWPEMGRQLIEECHSFRHTIEKLDDHLSSLSQPPGFSLYATMLEPKATSKVNFASYSQPVCTAVQIALVDLLAYCDIMPAAVVGHSSGEIAAAYAAGHITANECIEIAYYRGLAISQNRSEGAMLAAGMSQLTAQELIMKLGIKDHVSVACINSPDNVTFSGDSHRIDIVNAAAQAQGVFARKLRTDGNAYHSPHMEAVGEYYETLLSTLFQKESFGRSAPNRSRSARMMSSATAEFIGFETTRTPDYWRRNLETPVFFKTAIELLARTSDGFHYIEVGPHPALKLPITQTLAGKTPISYSSTLYRGKDGVETMLDLVGNLFLAGYTPSFSKVNKLFLSGAESSTAPKVLQDLPTYPWQYEAKLWIEPRISKEYRCQRRTRHDLLGTRVINGSALTSTWRNLLSTSTVKWLKDHKVGESTLMPAAAYLGMAAEASCQSAEISSTQSTLVFRHVDILEALTVPEDDGVELFTELRPTFTSNATASKDCWDFLIFSHSKGINTTHARGLVQTNKASTLRQSMKVVTSDFHEPLAARTLYEKFTKVGLVYGPRFQSLSEVYSSKVQGKQLTLTKTQIEKGGGTGLGQESEYNIHPASLDAVLQAGLIADGAGSILDLRPCVPVYIDYASIGPSFQCSKTGTIYAEAQRVGFDASTFDAELCDDQNHKLVELRGVRMIGYPGLDGSRLREERHPYLRVTWKPDIGTLWNKDKKDFSRALRLESQWCDDQPLADEVEGLRKALGLIAHKNPGIRVLDLVPDKGSTERFLDTLCAQTAFRRFRTYTLGSIDNRGLLFGRRIVDISEWEEGHSQPQELDPDDKFDVLVLPATVESTEDYSEANSQTLSSHAAPGALLLYVSRDPSSPSSKREKFGPTISSPLGSGRSVCMTRLLEPVVLERKSRIDRIFLVYNGLMHLFHTVLSTKLTEIFEVSVTLLSIDEIIEATIPSGATIVSTIELEKTMLKTANDTELEKMRTLIESASTMLWMTGGNLLLAQRPDFALYSGLARAVQLEQPSSKLLALDVDDFVSNPHAVATNVVNVLDQALHDPSPDYEYISHDGSLYISRFTPDELMNEDFNRRGKSRKSTISWEQAGRCQLAIDRVGQFDTLHFEPAPENQNELDPDFVEVQVEFVGLNAKDVYALGGKVDTKKSTCTLEFCGIITTVGSAVTDLASGDRVVVVAPGNFRSYERVPAWACQKLRDGEDFAAASTLMIVFATAIYGLQDRANLQAGESVLVHSASGGAGIAATQIAQLIGANVFATAGTDAKKQFLVESLGLKPENIFNSRDSTFLPAILEATDGRGVDVVFNSLIGEQLHDSWRACADFGRFVEIGKRDILEHGKLDMDVFKRGTTFTAFDLTELFYALDPRYRGVYQRLSQRVLELWRAGKITHVQPLKVFDVSDIVPAIRYFSSNTRMGKVAISLEPTSQVTFRPPRYSAVLNPNKSYIMVGCLGGLGRSLSKWMLSRGARNFVFIGRSGTDKPSARNLVNTLEEAGATVVVVKGNVCCLEDVTNAVSQATNPVGGVIQAAMGLNEALFTNMSEKYWHSGIDAKVLGTWNLHQALSGRDEQLDFFIMTSSVSGSIGTATEANYCAANHFLDNFAKYRSSLGLPATSLGLGMISEVGYLHEHPEIEELLLRKGIRPIDEGELLGIFDSVLSESLTSKGTAQTFANAHLLTGLEATGLKAQREQGFDGHRQVIDDPRALILLQSFNESSPQITYSASPGRNLSNKIKEVVQSGGELYDTIHGIIADKMANLILTPAENILPDTSLSSFGMDSMLAAELRAFLYQASGVDVPFQTLMDRTTNVESVARVIANEVERIHVQN